jgi:hypothetical protein
MSQAEPNFFLVLLTSQAELARYLNEPDQAEPSRAELARRPALLVPNNEDYNIDPNTYEGEFFQEDGLPGDFVIDITEALEIMEVEDDGGEEIDDDDDVVLLEKVAAGQDVDAPLADEYLEDMRDSDDETSDPDNLHEDVYY